METALDYGRTKKAGGTQIVKLAKETEPSLKGKGKSGLLP